jgi:hypothetical protein
MSVGERQASETSVQIKIRGHLDQSWSEWFDGLAVTSTGQGETLLCGPVSDQAMLHGVLMKIRDLGLPLISVNSVDDVAPTIGRGEH